MVVLCIILLYWSMLDLRFYIVSFCCRRMHILDKSGSSQYSDIKYVSNCEFGIQVRQYFVAICVEGDEPTEMVLGLKLLLLNILLSCFTPQSQVLVWDKKKDKQ
jgi:hypothetical protein